VFEGVSVSVFEFEFEFVFEGGVRQACWSRGMRFRAVPDRSAKVPNPLGIRRAIASPTNSRATRKGIEPVMVELRHACYRPAVRFRFRARLPLTPFSLEHEHEHELELGLELGHAHAHPTLPACSQM
jgi:hypothetical protein